jgi:hypothetical protein
MTAAFGDFVWRPRNPVIRNPEANELVGVARSPLAADLIGLIALLAALIGMWLWEGRRRLSNAP